MHGWDRLSASLKLAFKIQTSFTVPNAANTVIMNKPMIKSRLLRIYRIITLLVINVILRL